MPTKKINHTIKNIIIKKLFGFKDIDIKIDGNTLLLIGENGLGKTTILNIVYSVLSGKLNKINDVNFESVEITFTDGKKISIRKSELLSDEIIIQVNEHRLRHHRNQNYRRIHHIKRHISEESLSKIDNYLIDHDLLNKRPSYQEIDELRELLDVPAPIGLIEDYIEYFIENKRKIKFLNTIKNKINQEIIYFPTYRRIEEDLKNLGVNDNVIEESDNELLIQFGMDDVKNRIENVIAKIKEKSFTGYTKIAGKVITESLSKNNKKKDKINPEVLKIVFSRISEYVQKPDIDQVESLITNKKIYEKENKGLYILLKELTNLYKEQEILDKSITNFAHICNKYLYGKLIKYNQSSLEIMVTNENGNEIKLNQLSSGEKQIVSIFSKIYLENPEKRKIVLFDEPELSLSLAWQEKLIPDIINSGMCDLVIATTHSPFIFTNELSEYAKPLSDFIKISNDTKRLN